MSYKPPRYLYFYILFIVFFITLYYFSTNNLNERNLGEYNISKSADTKLDMGIKNVSFLKLEIKEVYINNSQSLCKSGDVYIFGTLRNRINNDIVRIRVEDIDVTNGLKIISKSTTIEPTRNYEHSPVNIISENFDCINEVITIKFEEKVNLSYLLIKSSDKYITYNKIKRIIIKAY